MDRHGDADDGGERFTEFMRQSAHRLYRVAYLLTGDPGQAEELTQGALVRTYTAWSRIRRDDAYTYARRVLANLHTDWWRGRLRRERPFAEPPDRPGGADPASAVAERRQVITALRGLSRRERAVIVCRFYLDMSEQQTADELDVAVGTVKSCTSRALAKLRVAPDLVAESTATRTMPEGAS